MSVKKQITKWSITASTIAALSIGGYKVGTFDHNKGFPVIDTVDVVADTMWFDDSLKLTNFARFGKVRFGNGKFNKKID